MNHDSIDRDQARTLGRAVATHSHDSLPAARVDELADLITAIKGALDDDAETHAAGGLLGFWAGHVADEIGAATTADSAADLDYLFKEGFEADTLGVDLYQALTKVQRATETDSETPDLAGWTQRLFELTNRHVAHLQSHQEQP